MSSELVASARVEARKLRIDTGEAAGSGFSSGKGEDGSAEEASNGRDVDVSTGVAGRRCYAASAAEAEVMHVAAVGIHHPLVTFITVQPIRERGVDPINHRLTPHPVVPNRIALIPHASAMVLPCTMATPRRPGFVRRRARRQVGWLTPTAFHVTGVRQGIDAAAGDHDATDAKATLPPDARLNVSAAAKLTRFVDRAAPAPAFPLVGSMLKGAGLAPHGGEAHDRKGHSNESGNKFHGTLFHVVPVLAFPGSDSIVSSTAFSGRRNRLVGTTFRIIGTSVRGAVP